MQVKVSDTEIGVVIGRFQVPTLHDGHKDLIDHVRSHHKKVLILVGSTPGILVTRRQPLDYHTRMLMIKEEYPDVVILPLYDQPSDEGWSDEVDRKIQETYGIGNATLYGSRDGFIPYYHGRYPTVELADTIQISGTQVRRESSTEVRSHEEFRRGAIYAAFNRYPTMFSTVDIAVRKGEELLLVRKRNDPEGKWRFPGGFLDPRRDTSLQMAAQREANEEIEGATFGDFTYVGSALIDDWRYRSEEDKIMTTVFTTEYLGGEIRPGDDLRGGALQWVRLDDVNPDMLMDQHVPILNLLTLS